jgi:hypothetical protein
MKTPKLNFRTASFMALTALAFTALSCSDDDNSNGSSAPDVNFTALSNTNSIVKYNARNLATPISSTPITGLAGGEQIVSIDYRPATGQLYALGSSSRIYFINEESGAATALGAAAFTPGISGANASIDFNPTVDRIRLVTEGGQNLRLNPETGAVAFTDGSINGGSSPKIGAVAYTNSTSGATATVLYDIDFETDNLYIQNPPNNGTLELVGALTVDFQGTGDFDIIADNSQAFAVTNNASISSLYSIDLTSGKATDLGDFGASIIGIAFKTNPIAYAVSATELFRFNPTTGTSTSSALTGLLASETIVGLDFRPANGQLYAITNQSRLVTINPSNGALAAVGAVLTPAISGTTFGFDFNPTVDRIRLVSNTGQNLRLHPDLGTVVFTDGNLNPGTPSVNAAAYTNSVAGATTTTLFVIDSATDMLYTQNPPNAGTLVPVGALGINVDADSGFDIGGSSGLGFAVLKVGSTNSVYSINLTTGAATKITDVSFQPLAMTVGLGF